MQGFDEEAQKREKKTKPKIRKQFLSERKDGKKDKIDIDFQSEYIRDDEEDDDVFNSEEDENENAMFQQLNRDIDIFNRDVTCGVDALRNSGMMDMSRAMNILELPSLQKFENTSEDEISKAFLLRMRIIMKNRNHSKGNQKDKHERYNSSKEDKQWRSQVLSLNEALQYLKRKKEVSGKAKENWKIQARQNALLNKTVGAFQFSAKNKDGTEKVMTKAESKLAQEMALEIAATLDNKTKQQNKTEKASTKNAINLNKLAALVGDNDEDLDLDLLAKKLKEFDDDVTETHIKRVNSLKNRSIINMATCGMERTQSLKGKGTRSRSTLSSGYVSSSRLPSTNEDSITNGRQRIVSDSGYQSYEPRRTKSVKY